MQYLTAFQSRSSPSTNESQHFQLIRDSHNQLKANADSILAYINGGHFVLLGLIIQPKKYETLPESPLVKHTNPGTHPSYPTGILVETTEEILRQHQVNQGSFHTMHNTDLALTKQNTSAFDSLYLKGIKRRHVKIPRGTIARHYPTSIRLLCHAKPSLILMTMAGKHFKNPIQRPPLAPHGVNVWYLVPAPLHYRCRTTYIK